MSNDEVERLRKLRVTALRVRAIARALENSQRQPMVTTKLQRVSGATWRISRAVSGQLRAHPYATFQKDAGTLTILANSLRASAVARFLGRHTRAAGYLAGELSTLSRLLDDARARPPESIRRGCRCRRRLAVSEPIGASRFTGGRRPAFGGSLRRGNLQAVA